ncbi:MAG: discoidin domain-containing protein [Clostridia bacterium]|nr:discoidin domain-containing protein [Clostridia bacterium]
MKKYLYIVFAAVLAMVLLLAACTPGQTADPTKAPEADVTTDAPAEEATPEVTEAPEEPTEEPTEAAPTEEPTATPEPEADKSIEKGTNVALTAEIEDVSSTTGATHVQWGWSYEFINDGIIYQVGEEPSLGWTTNVGVNPDDPDQEEWIIFCLDKYTSIDKVRVCPTISGVCFPVDFHIEVSLDGENYATVASVEGCNNAKTSDETPVELTFDAVTAKYVKFVATKLHDVPSGNDGILMQIGEIEIIAA